VSSTNVVPEKERKKPEILRSIWFKTRETFVVFQIATKKKSLFSKENSEFYVIFFLLHFLVFINDRVSATRALLARWWSLCVRACVCARCIEESERSFINSITLLTFVLFYFLLVLISLALDLRLYQ
jgi:hypothetical protein